MSRSPTSPSLRSRRSKSRRAMNSPRSWTQMPKLPLQWTSLPSSPKRPPSRRRSQAPPRCPLTESQHARDPEPPAGAFDGCPTRNRVLGLIPLIRHRHAGDEEIEPRCSLSSESQLRCPAVRCRIFSTARDWPRLRFWPPSRLSLTLVGHLAATGVPLPIPGLPGEGLILPVSEAPSSSGAGAAGQASSDSDAGEGGLTIAPAIPSTFDGVPSQGGDRGGNGAGQQAGAPDTGAGPRQVGISVGSTAPGTPAPATRAGGDNPAGHGCAGHRDLGRQPGRHRGRRYGHGAGTGQQLGAQPGYFDK